jgi:hypothetical protein
MRTRNATTGAPRRLVAAWAVASALWTGGCGTVNDASDVSVLEWSSSFGFCPPDEYCTTRLRVAGTQAVVTLESRQRPALRREEQLTPGEADALAQAAVQARFDDLEPVLGCPDCADGGAETLSATISGEHETVTFEYNARVPELEPLLDRMRTLAERLRPAS